MPDQFSGVDDLLKPGRFAPEIDSRLTPARDALSKARALMQGVPTGAKAASPASLSSLPAGAQERVKKAIGAARGATAAGAPSPAPEREKDKEKEASESPAAGVAAPPKMRARGSEGRKLHKRSRRGRRAHTLSR